MKRNGRSVWLGAGLVMAIAVPMVSDAQSQVRLGGSVSVRAPAFTGYVFRVSDATSVGDVRRVRLRVNSADVEIASYTFFGATSGRSVRVSETVRSAGYSNAVTIPSVGPIRNVHVVMRNLSSGTATVNLIGER